MRLPRPMDGIRAVLVPITVLLLLCAFDAQAQSRTYTLDADFAEGLLSNVNFDAPNSDQLQLNQGRAAFTFVNIAASSRGTAVRANTETGVITGEYFTAPTGRGRDPSRTTVDLLGNVWVGNRAEGSNVPGVGNRGSMTRVGLIIGGTRTDETGSPDPNGQYLMGPFEYNTCEDRHGTTPGTAPDGLIKTSRGLGNILPWTNAGSADSFGGVSTAEDECIINYVRAGGTLTRTITIDSNNDVWVGGLGDRVHEKVNGTTGERVDGSAFAFACGGYGGFIDGNGILWSMTSGSSYLRYDTNTLTGECRPLNNYGTGIDPSTGEVWITQLSGNRIHKLAPDGTLLGSFTHGNGNAQGLVVDNNGSVWVAHSLFSATTVGHLKTDGTYVGNVTLPGGSGPTGLAVDAAGKVWVANINSNNAMRIDPAAGPIGADGVTPVGAVDLVVNLGPGAGPYNYSDMTGSVAAGVTAPFGNWTVVYDGGANDTPWESISWTGATPNGSSIAVRARAANQQVDLPAAPWVDIVNGAALAGALSGRFIQIQTTLSRGPNPEDSPILFDLTVNGADGMPAECMDPNTAPSWDGMVVKDGGDRYLHIAAPQGLRHLRFYNTNNLVVLGLYASSDGGATFDDLSADYPLQMGGGEFWFNYEGDPDEEATEVYAKITAVSGSNVSFYLRAQDTCPRIVDLDPVISLDADGGTLPTAFALEQNYPNPFNPTTTIEFSLLEAGHASLIVYDVLGREVARLVDGQLDAGAHQRVWSGVDAAGRSVASGLYMYRLESNAISITRHMTLLK
jgi:hypothetical protein